jgi:predicted dehydrogenase
MLVAFTEGKEFHPNFADGLACQKVLDAVVRSSDTRTWQQV